MNKIVTVIQNTLTRHRIVFWYEVSAEFKARAQPIACLVWKSLNSQTKIPDV